MPLSKKVKVGLDETRILILGCQILPGFQFQGAFRPAFEMRALHGRHVWLSTLALITPTIGLPITSSVQQSGGSHASLAGCQEDTSGEQGIRDDCAR